MNHFIRTDTRSTMRSALIELGLLGEPSSPDDYGNTARYPAEGVGINMFGTVYDETQTELENGDVEVTRTPREGYHAILSTPAEVEWPETVTVLDYAEAPVKWSV